MAFNSLIILGPTASGKTNLSVSLAKKLDAEIISADSRQVYCGLDIGSGKDISEYFFEGQQIPYHLIDVVDPKEEYNLYKWKTEVEKIFPQILKRKKFPIICGGTGMYLDSLLRNYDLPDVPTNFEMRKQVENYSLEELQQYFISMKPKLHNDTDLTERHRLLRAIEIFLWLQDHNDENKTNILSSITTNEKNLASNKNITDNKTLNIINSFVIGVFIERETLCNRIYKRLVERVDEGLIDEVKNLHDKNFVSWERLERFGLEYRFVSEYLEGKIDSKEKMIESLFVAIRQFSKRQMTWFRGMERKGVKINWVEGGKENTVKQCLDLIEKNFF